MNHVELKIEYLPIDGIKPYSGNAKLHPAEQVEQIKRSIAENGMCDPIGIWGPDNTVREFIGERQRRREMRNSKRR